MFLSSLLVSLGLHINLSKYELHLTQHFPFLGLCQDTVDMSVSLPSDKLAEILQLSHSLFQRQPVTVNQTMSLLATPIFCASGHAQHCQLCQMVSVAAEFCSLLIISSLCGYYYRCYTQSLDISFFMVLCVLNPLVEPGQVLCGRFISPCKNSRLLY